MPGIFQGFKKVINLKNERTNQAHIHGFKVPLKHNYLKFTLTVGKHQVHAINPTSADSYKTKITVICV